VRKNISFIYNKLRVYSFKDFILRFSLVVLYLYTRTKGTLEKFILPNFIFGQNTETQQPHKKLLSLACKTYKNDHAPSTGSNDRVFYTNSVGNLLLQRNYSISIGTVIRHFGLIHQKRLLGRVHEPNRQELIVLFRASTCLCYHTV
jgi:hypothetical protein